METGFWRQGLDARNYPLKAGIDSEFGPLRREKDAGAGGMKIMFFSKKNFAGFGAKISMWFGIRPKQAFWFLRSLF